METKAQKCGNCNRPIKYSYDWKGQELGIECWKQIALPTIKAEREAKWQAEWEERQMNQWEQNYALVEALKLKDFSKIKSEFKVKFLNGLVEQFEDKGFISDRQKEMVYGTGGYRNGFRDLGMLNRKDQLHEAVALYNIGGEVNQESSLEYARMLMNDKERDLYCEATGVDRGYWSEGY